MSFCLGNPSVDSEPPTEEDVEAFYSSLMEEVNTQQVEQQEAPEEEE